MSDDAERHAEPEEFSPGDPCPVCGAPLKQEARWTIAAENRAIVWSWCERCKWREFVHYGFPEYTRAAQAT